MFGAIADFVGGIITNRTNKGINEDNNRFTQMMSSTAYQRAMKDMRAGGLNPILAASRGGASTPAGSMIPQQNPASGMQEKMFSAKGLKKLEADIANVNQLTKKAKEETDAISKQATQADMINSLLETFLVPIVDAVTTNAKDGGLKSTLKKAGEAITSTGDRIMESNVIVDGVNKAIKRPAPRPGERKRAIKKRYKTPTGPVKGQTRSKYR